MKKKHSSFNISLITHPAVLLCARADYSKTVNGKYCSWRQKAINLASFKLLAAKRDELQVCVEEWKEM